jgi:hypothetical protein
MFSFLFIPSWLHEMAATLSFVLYRHYDFLNNNGADSCVSVILLAQRWAMLSCFSVPDIKATSDTTFLKIDYHTL